MLVWRQSKVADDTAGTPKKPLAPFYHVTQGRRVDQVLQGGSFFSYAEGGSPYLQARRVELDAGNASAAAAFRVH
ncbi:hypothetical protein CDAR_74991 [Caerostris darwini]|uniref:Uncharacterized protein n=1 Tax=Caerostris darwini TaxID=1538125 RepID=A0AAV4P3Q8_9ARAC|nr:hypothetical protein CDAR_74991 [Caerostris darwini]